MEARRLATIERIAKAIGGAIAARNVEAPLNYRNGFNEAYYGWPEAFLDPVARLACSSLSLIANEVVERFVKHLARDLNNGTWDARYGHLRTQPSFKGPLRLVVGK